MEILQRIFLTLDPGSWMEMTFEKKIFNGFSHDSIVQALYIIGVWYKYCFGGGHFKMFNRIPENCNWMLLANINIWH